jgi:MFS family permease
MRAFAGLGLALACPAGFGLIGETITHEPERSIVFAAFGLGGPIGASSGTILGGGVAGINQLVAVRVGPCTTN